MFSPRSLSLLAVLLCVGSPLLTIHAAPLLVGPGETLDLGNPGQPTSQGYDSLTVELGGTLNLLGNATLNIAGDINIIGSITANPSDKAAPGAPGPDGSDGPDNSPTGINAGTGGILGQMGQNWTVRPPPRLDLRSQGTVILRGSIILNPDYDGGNGGRGGHGGKGGSASPGHVGGFGGQAGSGAAGGHAGLEGPTLRIFASQIELRAGSRISLDNLGQGGEGGIGGNGGHGGRGGDNPGEGPGSPGGGGGPAGHGGDGGSGGNGGTLWLTADRISMGGEISVRGGTGGNGGQAGIPGNGGDGGNANGIAPWPGGSAGDAGNPGLTAFHGGHGGRGGNGGTINVRADELLVGIAPDLRGGDGGTGGEGRPAGLATGGQGGSGSPPGSPGMDSGTLQTGSTGLEGIPGRLFLYVNWNITPFDPYWLLGGNPGCGGPFLDTDDELVTRSGFALCGGQCLSHLVNVDSESPFVLEFDYRWLTTTGSLEFHVGDQLVHTLSAPASLTDAFTRETVILSDPALRSPFFQTLRICALPDDSAMVQLANLAFRADPNAGNPPPVITVDRTTPGDSVAFSWGSVAGQRYQLQRRDSLSTGNWADLGAAIDGTGSPLNTSAPIDPADAEAFYRLLVRPAPQ